jgi:hypothetical protein
MLELLTYSQSIFGVQLDRLEVLNIFGVEEHVPDRGSFLVAPQRISRQDDALQDYP